MIEILTLGIFALALIICLSFDITVIAALLIGFLCFFSYGLYKGFSVKQLLLMAGKGQKTGFNIMVVLSLIGLLTASWRISGTIPYLVSFAVNFISPDYCLFFAFVLNAALSLLIGTAFGTSATMGVITMSICIAAGADPMLAGGAVLAGCYVGDRNSPVSSSASLVAVVTKTDLYQNVRLMLFSAAIPFVLSCLIYFGFGVSQTYQEIHMALGEQFAQEFVMSWWSAVPAIILLGLIFAKLDIKKSISISVLSALVLAFVLQERGIEEILNTLFSGYVSKNLSLSKMLNGGGFLSMVPVVIIICISCTYSGLFEGTALIDTLKNGVEKISKKSTPFTAILLTAITTALISCNQVLTVILTKQLCANIQPDKQKMAIDLENSSILIPALIPWSIAGAVPIATVGAPVSSVLGAFFIYLVPLYWLVREKAALAKERS